MACVMMWLLPMVSQAAITPSMPTNGDGTSSNPYQISTAAELYWYAALVNGTLTDGTAQNPAACAKLTANITVNSGVLNADGTLSANSSGFTQWDPIGVYESEEKMYTGTFDGNGKTISGLYVNDAEKYNVGLFGLINGTVKNVGVVDSYFNAEQNVGGICGFNQMGTIANCYHLGTVVGNNVVGGISGYNHYAIIANCYYSGSVSITGSNAFYVGGVGGLLHFGEIENCYFNKDKCSENISGYSESDGSSSYMGKTTAQFQSGEIAYLLSKGCTVSDRIDNVSGAVNLKGGFFDGSEWGQSLGTDTYPVLGGKEVFYGSINCLTSEEGYSNSSTPHDYDNKGFCTRCDGYQPAEYVSESHHAELLPEYRDYYAIENAGQLYWLADQVNNQRRNGLDAVLTAHITVNSGVIDSNGELASNTNGFRPWTPIGWRTDTEKILYNGIVDGRNYQISGLYINDESADQVGLLGYTIGTVRNLGIMSSYFKGRTNVGSMYGYGSGRIVNCFSYNCQVHGNECVGGMCGNSYGTTTLMCNSYFVGTVSGTKHVGSMCGYSAQANTIANCYYDKEKCSIGGIDGADVAGQAEGKTKAEFQSGAIAYHLSQGCTVDGEEYAGTGWGQILNWLDYPLLGIPQKVYYGYDTCDENADMVYTNQVVTDRRLDHSFGEHGFCTACTTGYQPAEVVSATHHAELAKTHAGYYAIENGGQLSWFGRLAGKDGTVNGVLTADVVLNTGDLLSYNGVSEVTWRTWDPIGNGYSGKFDGNGHTVSGMFINNISQDYVGLFGVLNTGATVSNVNVENFYIFADTYVGGVCGTNNGTIVNSQSNGVIYGYLEVGGICGRNTGRVEDCISDTEVGYYGNDSQRFGGISGTNRDNGTLINCTSKGSVNGGLYVGGVTALNYGTITNCKSSGVGIHGVQYVGGVSGMNYEAGVITGCKNSAMVGTRVSAEIDRDYAGGVCAYNLNRIEYCESQGIVEGDKCIGGICGYNKGTLSHCKRYGSPSVIGQYDVGGVCGENDELGKIEFCSNSGGVAGSGPTVSATSHCIGGVCGTNNGNITGCFNTGVIEGTFELGGLCGENNANITNSYNRGQISGSEKVGGLCGYNTSDGLLRNCYNAGVVELESAIEIAVKSLGNVSGINSGTLSNCYYDKTVCDAAGIYNATDEEGKVVGRITTQFQNGEVACLLAQGTDGSVWGQQLGADTYPILESSYKIVRAAQDGANENFWATFSNQEADVELCVPSGQSLTVYNATVSGGVLNLSERDNTQVAKGEGVLLLAGAEYLNAKTNETDELSPVAYAFNNLVATPSEAQTITAESGYTLYRLTYNNASTKSGLGFYLGVAGNVKDGSQLKATPGKAYLKVAATETANAQAFIFPEGGEVTAIEGITPWGTQPSETEAEAIYDLTGRKVSRAAHGLYIRNGQKVIIR